MLIKFAGQTFELHPDGTLYWPDKKLLIISDLHFEKGSSLALHGIFLPPYDTSETLNKLQEACDRIQPETLLFLGDVFHDKSSLLRITQEDRDKLQAILDRYEIIWIEGNHDEGHAPDNIDIHTQYKIDDINFIHIADKSYKGFEISGHYHPSVKFVHKEHKIRRPCFVTNATKMIVPSFGVLTGGLYITDPVYRPILGSQFNTYILGTKDVLKLHRSKIRR